MNHIPYCKNEKCKFCDKKFTYKRNKIKHVLLKHGSLTLRQLHGIYGIKEIFK